MQACGETGECPPPSPHSQSLCISPHMSSLSSTFSSYNPLRLVSSAYMCMIVGRPLEHGNSVSGQTLNKDRFSLLQQLPMHGQQLLRTLKNNFQAQVILWGIISKWASIFKGRLGRSNDCSNIVTWFHSLKVLQSIFSPLITKLLAISPSLWIIMWCWQKDSSWHFQRVHDVFGRSVVYTPITSNRKAWECDVLKQEDPRWLQSCSIHEGKGISVWHCAPFLDL